MITFEKRAVAFIDILGFKNLVDSAVSDNQSLQELSKLVNLLEGAVLTLDESVSGSVPKHLIPDHIYISDCIILSAPINDEERTNYDGLSIVIMRVIQLTHFFLKAGYLIRGGISVGEVWHTDSNIVGPAYQDAYLLEEKGDKPMVLLSDSAQATLRGGSRMCIQRNGDVFVNGLYNAYLPGKPSAPYIIDKEPMDKIDEKAYQCYAKLIKENLDSQIPGGAKCKWRWFGEYLEAESKKDTQWKEA